MAVRRIFQCTYQACLAGMVREARYRVADDFGRNMHADGSRCSTAQLNVDTSSSRQSSATAGDYPRFQQPRTLLAAFFQALSNKEFAN